MTYHGSYLLLHQRPQSPHTSYLRSCPIRYRNRDALACTVQQCIISCRERTTRTINCCPGRESRLLRWTSWYSRVSSASNDRQVKHVQVHKHESEPAELRLVPVILEVKSNIPRQRDAAKSPGPRSLGQRSGPQVLPLCKRSPQAMSKARLRREEP